MKCFIIAAFVVVLAPCVSNASDVDDWKTLREEMHVLRAELARQGAYAFVTNRTTTPPVAPHIHSQCWVDWLPKTNIEQIAYEQEKRDLGLDFFVDIEGLALPGIPLENPDGLEQHADKMLTIAEWLKTADGYGNHVLKTWCENIALSAMGGMAVNPGCDTNRVLRLVARLDCLQKNVARRVAILNEESPHRYKVPQCSTYDEAAKDLERQCHSHKLNAWKYYGQKDGRRNFTFDKVKDDPAEYAFYVPERSSGSSDSIRTEWQIKNHEVVCIYGQECNMVDQIIQILRYRTLIGDVPVPTENEIADLNLAFDYRTRLHDVWQKHTKGKELYFLGADAILKIYGHTFVDFRTRSLQLQLELGSQSKAVGK